VGGGESARTTMRRVYGGGRKEKPFVPSVLKAFSTHWNHQFLLIIDYSDPLG